MATDKSAVPTWAIALLGVVSPLVAGGISYITSMHTANAVIEQRLGDVEHRTAATDAKLEMMISKLTELSINVAVLVERSERGTARPGSR